MGNFLNSVRVQHIDGEEESDEKRRYVMKKKVGRIFVIGIVLSWMFVFQGIDLAEAKDPDYPTKPITFYIGYSAGGTTDVSARAITEATSKYLGQPIIPINKPGAGGALGSMAVMNAKPDGTLWG